MQFVRYDTEYKDPWGSSKAGDFAFWSTRKQLQREIKLKTQPYLSHLSTALFLPSLLALEFIMTAGGYLPKLFNEPGNWKHKVISLSWTIKLLDGSIWGAESLPADKSSLKLFPVV